MGDWHLYLLAFSLVGIAGTLVFMAWNKMIPEPYAKWVLLGAGVLFTGGIAILFFPKDVGGKSPSEPSNPDLGAPSEKEVQETDSEVVEASKESKKILKGIEDTEAALDDIERKEKNLKRREDAIAIDGFDLRLSAFRKPSGDV